MILRRYLIREVSQAFFAILLILVLIYVSDHFVRYLGDAAAGRIAAGLIAKFIALKLATQIALLLPLAFYLAILLGLGRLYRDSEIVAMTAGGLGPVGLLRMVFWFAAGVAAVTTALSLYVAPKAEGHLQDLRQRAKDQADATGIYPGRFKEFNQGDQVLYVQEAASRSRGVRGVFGRLRADTGEDIVVAESAHQHLDKVNGGRFVVLINGHRYQGNAGEASYVVTRFGRYAVRIDESRDQEVHQRIQALATQALLRPQSVSQIAELARRFSQPVSVLVLGALAVPLSRTTPRRGRFAKLLPATLVYFIYFNLLSIVQNLVLRGDLGVAVGVWLVPAVAALLAAGFIYYQSSASRWLWRVRRRLWEAT